jgi:glycosyltransferase involved in cell wall biosynthesis
MNSIDSPKRPADVPAGEEGRVPPLPVAPGRGPRRVFFLVDSLNLGGTETQAVELARRLDPTRYQVTLGCLRVRGPLLERLKGSRVVVREFYPEGGVDSPLGIYQLLRLAVFLRRGRFDVFHSNDLWSTLMGVPAARLARVPVIISSRRDLGHLEWYRMKRRAWLQRIQSLSHVILTNANSIRDWLIADEGVSPNKVHVIHNGVEVERFCGARRERERLFPSVGDGKLVVLVGNMHSDVKGHPWLIAAAPEIVKEFPQTRFVLVGDGKQRKAFERRAAESGVQRSFLFLGRREDIPQILACCDIAVLPSRAEGLPNAVLEYMAAGLPVVASNVGGNSEVIRDGETGLLVPPQDANALSGAILRLFHEPDMAGRLAQHGQEHVRKNFGYERLVRDLDRLYGDLLAQRVGARSRKSPGQTWSQRLGRLSSMDREELSHRLWQHVNARADALRYCLGIGFSTAMRAGRGPQQPRFFFASEHVPALCSLLKQRLPQQAEEIVRHAERICGHRFDLLGYENLDYGPEIDWHGDRVHGKRAPRKPWFKLRYLDFAQVGDVKVTWELNRHQHLVTLAKAYRLTGDERLAAELFRQWRHWQQENPYPIGVNWASSLEVAMRSLSWIWMYFLLGDSSTALAGFRDEWVRALATSGRHIERNLSTYFSPNTHLLGEAVALFFIGTLCPELAPAERWKQQGWEIILREAKRQVRSDGLHFEQSIYYHVYALDFFIHAAVLAAANDVPVPPEFERTLEKMLSALCLLCRAGSPPQLGDDDGGRLFDPHRNRSEHLFDPLATGAVLYGRGDFKSVSGGLREETLWLLGSQGAAELDRIPAKPPEPASTALEASGLYLMADAASWQQIVIDAGSQATSTAGHAHADALSVCWNHDGRPLLIDSGTFEYAGDGPERNQFRGTNAHNTLLVDGMDEAEPRGQFGWSDLPRVSAEGWVSGQHFDLFVASHDGYCRLMSPVVHRRWVFSLKSGFWLVRDLVLGEAKHQLELSWHLGPGLSARGGSACEFVDNAGHTRLRMLAVEGTGWSQEMRQGWWSPVYGRKEPALVVSFSATATLPTEFVTLFVAATQAGPDSSLTRIAESSEQVSGFRYREPDEEHGMFFAKPGESWAVGPWASDAGFFYYGRAGQRRVLICCNGTHLEVGGKRILGSPRPVLRCEIIAYDENVEVISSDPDVVVKKEMLNQAWTELEPMVASGSRKTGK